MECVTLIVVTHQHGHHHHQTSQTIIFMIITHTVHTIFLVIIYTGTTNNYNVKPMPTSTPTLTPLISENFIIDRYSYDSNILFNSIATAKINTTN